MKNSYAFIQTNALDSVHCCLLHLKFSSDSLLQWKYQEENWKFQILLERMQISYETQAN